MARRQSMETLTSALEVIGAVTISVGAGLAWLPAGFITAGIGLIGAGWLLAPSPPRGDQR